MTDGAKTHTYADGPSSPRDHGRPGRRGRHLPRCRQRASASRSTTWRPRSPSRGAASVNEGSAYSLTLGAVTDPGTDTVSSYIVHWGDGNSDTYTTDGAKTHTYADGPSNPAITVDLVDEDGTFLDAANAFSVTVNNVAPTIAISRCRQRQRGLGLQPDPGRGHRPRHRHGQRATSSTGATATPTPTRQQRRQDATPTPTAPTPGRSRSTWSTRTAPSSMPPTRFSVTVNNVAPDDRHLAAPPASTRARPTA